MAEEQEALEEKSEYELRKLTEEYEDVVAQARRDLMEVSQRS